MKPLTHYTDYRIYLRDWVDHRKVSNLPISNRWFAQKMGVNSSSWLTALLNGTKNLSRESANKLSTLLKHSAFETRFFETLIFFNQARTLPERNRFYDELSLLQKSREARLVSADQYDYYTAWYHSAVRSLIGMYRFSGDYQWLANMVVPAISVSQARKSVQLLERLALVRRNEQRWYELTDQRLGSGENVRSLAITNFQTETMRLAQEALDRFSLDERNISTVTVGVSAKGASTIREILADARRRIVEVANGEAAADRVMQLNMQFFPLSKSDPATLNQESS
jgi:uncharacterized protein (TIGR02147 family)